MIIIDLWGGDLHTNHIGHHEVPTWIEACEIMFMAIENGFLCNVLHSDFDPPEWRAAEQDAAFEKILQNARAGRK